MIVHADDFTNGPPETYLFHAKPSVAARTATAVSAATLDIEVGDTYYLLPQTSQQGQLFLGFGYSTVDYPANTIDVTHTISNFDGPGNLVLWQAGEEGAEIWVHTGRDDWSFTSPASHEHLNWGLTAPGTYTFEASSTVVTRPGGEPVGTTGTQTYTFYVGEELPDDEEPPVEPTLTITGAAAHYHTGDVANLSLDPTPEPGATIAWQTRPSADGEWSGVPGAAGPNYGFVVTADHQVRAVLLADDGSVATASDPVDIGVDDHGNTPVLGPEIQVALPEEEGALVITVAAGSQQARLSDLTLSATADRYVASGSIGGITITDTRSGDLGWAANGRLRELTTVDGDVLGGQHVGWTPRVLEYTPGQQVTAGDAVAPALSGSGGISGWQHLGSAGEGASRGVTVLGADVTVEAPVETEPGDYSGVVLLTVV